MTKEFFGLHLHSSSSLFSAFRTFFFSKTVSKQPKPNTIYGTDSHCYRPSVQTWKHANLQYTIVNIVESGGGGSMHITCNPLFSFSFFSLSLLLYEYFVTCSDSKSRAHATTNYLKNHRIVKSIHFNYRKSISISFMSYIVQTVIHREKGFIL